jgi:hypothetical protein
MHIIISIAIFRYIFKYNFNQNSIDVLRFYIYKLRKYLRHCASIFMVINLINIF